MARIRSPHHTVPLHLLALAIADLPGAIQHLQFALSMEPGNSAIQAKLDALRRG